MTLKIYLWITSKNNLQSYQLDLLTLMVDTESIFFVTSVLFVTLTLKS